MNRSGEEQERVLFYLEEEAKKKQKSKLRDKMEDQWKGAQWSEGAALASLQGVCGSQSDGLQRGPLKAEVDHWGQRVGLLHCYWPS